MCEIVEIIKIKKEEGKECIISQLIETLNDIREKYSDIEIIIDSGFTSEIKQIVILEKDDNGGYFAEISD